MIHGASLDALVNQFNSDLPFVISTHISPDPDAIGSAFGLCLALRNLGKDAYVYLHDAVPDKLSFFVTSECEISPQAIENLDKYVFVAVDCATQRRLGNRPILALENAVSSINIDHHRSNPLWADLNYVEDIAASTAEIIYTIINRLNIAIDTKIANLLYAGILDDTGCFRYRNTVSSTLNIASELVALGAEPESISNKLYFQVPLNVMKFRAACTSEITLMSEGRLGLMLISQDFMKKYSCTAEDTEGLVDIVRSIEGVQVAAFARQLESPSSKFKFSFRSTVAEIDVDSFAQKWGGGGHRAAAGCTIEGTFDEVSKIMHAELPSLLG